MHEKIGSMANAGPHSLVKPAQETGGWCANCARKLSLDDTISC